jgi:hypothetical protein
MKNIHNATQNQEKAQDSRDNAVGINAGKQWEVPTITEISRFAILGGPEVGKAEGVTEDGSVG